MTLYITADRKRFVPAGHADAAFGIAEPDIDRLGLREAYEDFIRPPEVKASAKIDAAFEPPKPKKLPKPSNKMVRKHLDK